MSTLSAPPLNGIFNIAIGCLMMPFVTWGIGGIDKGHTAHGTALLNSLRTISGAIGIAVFVGIFNTVSVRSSAAYGANAGIHGANVTFAAMAVVALLLVAMTAIFIKPAKNAPS